MKDILKNLEAIQLEQAKAIDSKLAEYVAAGIPISKLSLQSTACNPWRMSICVDGTVVFEHTIKFVVNPENG